MKHFFLPEIEMEEKVERNEEWQADQLSLVFFLILDGELLPPLLLPKKWIETKIYGRDLLLCCIWNNAIFTLIENSLDVSWRTWRLRFPFFPSSRVCYTCLVLTCHRVEQVLFVFPFCFVPFCISKSKTMGRNSSSRNKSTFFRKSPSSPRCLLRFDDRMNGSRHTQL